MSYAISAIPHSGLRSAVDAGMRAKHMALGSLVFRGTTGADLQRLLGKPDFVTASHSGVSVTYCCHYREAGIVVALSPWFGERPWSFPAGPVPPRARVTGVARIR